MESKTQPSGPAREEQRPQGQDDSALAGQAPDVIRVGVARVPSFSLTRARRRPGT